MFAVVTPPPGFLKTPSNQLTFNLKALLNRSRYNFSSTAMQIIL